jgi:tyrosine-protein phosphatase YwqE
VQRRPQLLVEIVEEGALVCFNADSLLGWHQIGCEECAWRLLELGIGEFVASDAHRAERPSRLREAVKAIAERYGRERAQALAEGQALTIIGDRPKGLSLS